MDRSSRAFQERPGKCGAEVTRMWLDADARQVEPIPVPARADGCIVAHLALVVPDQGVLKLLETLVVKLKEFASDRPRPVGGALAVLGVVEFVLALRVVQR